MVAQAATGGHKEKPGFGGKGGAGGDRGGGGGEHKEKPDSHKEKPGSHKESNPQHKKKYHAHIWGNLEHKMSIRNQPCPRRDGGMEVDGDMQVGSIKNKTLSIKINTQPQMKAKD